MINKFNYKKFDDADMNGLVEAGSVLAQKYAEDKFNTQEYLDANAQFNRELVAACVKPYNTVFGKEITFETMRPEIANNMLFTQQFNTILAQVITPVLPQVITNSTSSMYDVIQVGWGQNAIYKVKSNELYVVSDAAKGIRRGGVLTSHDAEYTVGTHKKEVAVTIDWYDVLSGKMDWGEEIHRTATSYATYIQGLVVSKLQNVIQNSAAAHGISGYVVSGAFSDSNWVTVSQAVSKANGGVPVYGLGTKIGLMNIMPASTNTQFRYGEDGAIVKTGFLPDYKGTALVELDQALVPNTINGTPSYVLNDKIIYVVAMGSHKPVKVAIMGETLTVSTAPVQSDDHTYTYTVNANIGADVIIGSKIGALIMP